MNRAAKSFAKSSNAAFVDCGVSLESPLFNSPQSISNLIKTSEQYNTLSVIGLSTQPFNTKRAVELCEDFDFPIFHTVGYSSKYAHLYQYMDDRTKQLNDLIADYKSFISAIGLLGIDPRFLESSSFDNQAFSMQNQILLANELQLPVVVKVIPEYQHILETIRECPPDILILNSVTDLNYHNIIMEIETKTKQISPLPKKWDSSIREHLSTSVVDLDKFISDFTPFNPYYTISPSLNPTFESSNLWDSHVHKIPLDRILLQTNSPFSKPPKYDIKTSSTFSSENLSTNTDDQYLPGLSSLLFSHLKSHWENDSITPENQNTLSPDQIPDYSQFISQIFENSRRAFPIIDKFTEVVPLDDSKKPEYQPMIFTPSTKKQVLDITPRYPVIDCSINLATPPLRPQFRRQPFFDQAVEHNVSAAINLNSGIQSFLMQFQQTQSLKLPVFHTVGYPPFTGKRWVKSRTKKALRKIYDIFQNNLAAIGPIGLTGKLDTDDPSVPNIELQVYIFLSQLSLAQELGIPAVCTIDTHWKLFFSILDRHPFRGTLIIHDFCGEPEHLIECHRRKIFTSFSASSFHRFEPLLENNEQLTAPLVNFDLFLLESNSPFCTPKPLYTRLGKSVNNPANIHYIFSQIRTHFPSDHSDSYLAKLFFANSFEAFPILKNNRIKLDEPLSHNSDNIPTHISFSLPPPPDQNIEKLTSQFSFSEYGQDSTQMLFSKDAAQITGISSKHQENLLTPDDNSLLDIIMAPDDTFGNTFPPVVDIGAYLSNRKIQNIGIRRVLRDAEKYNVRGIISMNPSIDSAKRQIEMSKRQNYLKSLKIFHTAGVGPIASHTWTSKSLNNLDSLVFENPRSIVAIGELGLLASREHISDLAIQTQIFNEQLDFAQSHNLPVIYRCHGHWDEFFKVIESRGSSRFVPGVLLSFGGSIDHFLTALRFGFYVSLNCSITHETSPNRKLLPFLPPDRILIESCSPFFFPSGEFKYPFSPLISEQAHQGVNIPSNIQYLVGFLARKAKMPPYEIAKVLFRNSISIFPKIRTELLGTREHKKTTPDINKR